jgi:5'-phosphate synthase pdxT subunit
MVRPIGVLALQGDFHAHARALADVGMASREVRHAADLRDVSALILPGGESTTLVKLVHDMGLAEPLRAFVREQNPVLGTCAGAILMAARVVDREQFSFGWIDIDIRRNAYGRQRESFETAAGIFQPPVVADSPGPAEMVFIRAPRIVRVGPAVQVLATHDGEPVLVQQRGVMACTFHPEMGADRAIHRYLAARAAAAPGTVRLS